MFLLFVFWGSPPSLERERERERITTEYFKKPVFFIAMFGWGPPNIAIKTTGLVPQMAIPTPCPPYPHKLPFKTWFLNLVLNLIFEVFWALDSLRKDESAPYLPLPPYPHKLPFKKPGS